jgi:hypothetical protein
VLIDDDLIRFCARQTRDVIDEYNAAWGVPTLEEEFPRSADELHLIMMGRYELPIYHRTFDKLSWRDTKFRSIYIPYDDRVEIYYAAEMPTHYLRYYKTKELLQIHLWQQSLVTEDIVDLVQNMILRESPTSTDLNLGHPATSDTLGEIAAMEYLFPLAHRLNYAPEKNGIAKLAEKYNVPAFVVQRSLNTIEPLKSFFC